MSFRQRIASWLAGPATAAVRSHVQASAPRQTLMRSYASARPSRFNVGLGSSGNSSADAELASSLTQLRAASRQMVRDASYAKRAKALIVNNVIGPGVGLQAQTKTTRDELNRRVNDDIEKAWADQRGISGGARACCHAA